MSKKKTKIVMGVVVLIAFLLTLGISYAIWSMTLTQKTSNVITTGCFKIEFQDENPINLQSAYPISNEEGLKLEPYTFTITNTCESYASYQINLEILNTTTLNRFEFVKNSLNEKEPSVLTNFDTAQTTLSDASTSKKLETGFLDKLESKTFTLRLWLDEDTPAIPEVMNKTIDSKITIITSLLPEPPNYAEVITNCSNNGYRTADCMLENSKYDTVNLAYDETVDNNLRYIGASPNNYVKFNDELWRVIGVMNNVEDADGQKDSRIKLIRDESIGKFSWDSSPSNINGGLGVNEWSQADAMKLMNPGYETESIGGSLYWNRKSGICYNGQNNSTASCDFTNSGLNIESKSMIEKINWNIGATIDQKNVAYYLISNMYTLERGNSNGKTCSSGTKCNDTIARTTKWIGYIGLMYASDYGYATAGNKNVCFNTILSSWYNNADITECYQKDWLYDAARRKWHLTMASDPTYAAAVLSSLTVGHVNASSGFYAWHIYPVFYLKSNVKIVDGNGTKENAYKLEMVGE